ncbi:MAG TPA: GAF domain-containing protein [Candidatus Limnocylindrales bacterium]
MSRRTTLLTLVARYGVAIAAVAMVTVLREASAPLLGDRAAYVPFLIAVAFAAWLGGLLPGLLATLLGGAAGALLIAEPRGSFDIASRADELAMSIFAAGGIVVSLLAAGTRTGRRRAETARAAAEGHAARAGRLEAVAIAVGRELRPKEAAEAVLREGLATLGAGAGVVGVLEDDGRTIRSVARFGFRDGAVESYETYSVDDPYPVSEAVRSREPIVVTGGEALRRRYPALAHTIPDGGTALVLPLVYEERAIGGIYFRFSDARAFDDDDLGYLMALGRQCAAALQRARLYETEYAARQSAQIAAERLVFLAHASEVLGSSLDYESTVAAVARLAVRQFADWCSVWILEPDDTIRMLALEHADPEKLGVARRYLALDQPRLSDEHGAGAAIRTNTTEHVEWITPEMLEGAFVEPERLELLRAIAPRSSLTVPLAVRDRTLGAISLVSAESQRRFDDADRRLAEDLAHRAATAIDNARLFRDREETSRELRDRARQQEAVSKLGQHALVDEDLDRLFEATVAEVATVLDLELATLLELDPATRTLRVVARTGWPVSGPAPAPVDVTHGSPGAALLSAEPVVVDTSRENPGVATLPFLTDARVVAHASVALTASGGRGRPWGILAVQSHNPRRFGREDITFLRAVGNVLIGAIDRERKLDEERRAQDVGRAFIGVVSHELRTPITSIYAGAKLLHRRVGNDAERAELAADIEAEADRLYRLTEDLLVLTRLERHDLDLGREPILVKHLLGRVLASEERRWPLVTFETHVAAQLDTATGEESYVEQVIRNLLSNAAKYSPAGSVVEVVAESNGEDVSVRVLDRGPGLGSTDPAQLFALFYRAPGTASQASGAGIGLFVCDQLVRAMGGRLWARPRDGGGSEFGFSLATYVDEHDAAPERAAAGGELAMKVSRQA